MLRFFHIDGFSNPVALEVSNPLAPMFELLPDKSLKNVDPMDVIPAMAQAGGAKRADIFVINVSNVTFAVYGKELPDVEVHALEKDQKWAACDLGSAPETDWTWLHIGAKAALIAWMASRRKRDEKETNQATNLN